MKLLEIKNVSKKYKNGVVANDQLSLEFEKGQVFGLLGPNGAGKTTVVNQIIGLAAPSSGNIYINGVDITENVKYAQRVCSLQPQSQIPINGVTPRQAVEIVGRIRDGSPDEVKRRTSELLNALEISDWADIGGHNLSGGIRRLTAFCMAVVMPGKLVILDEPTNDVDPLRRRLLWEQVRSLAEAGSAVLLVTHNVLEAERVVDQLAILNKGGVVASGTPASLKNLDAHWLRLELILEPGSEPPLLPNIISSPILVRSRIIARILLDDLTRVVSWIQSHRESAAIDEFSVGPTTLEDIYLRAVGWVDSGIDELQEGCNELSTSLA